MAASFGAVLRGLREDRGLTQPEVAALVTTWLHRHKIDQTASGAAVGQWEAGATPQREKVAALEELFDQPRGTLARMLGYLPEDFEPVRSIEAAITADEDLSPSAKAAMRTFLRALRKAGPEG